MQQLAGWCRDDNDDPIVHLVTRSCPTLKAGSHMEMDMPSLPQSSPDLLRRVWKATREALSVEGPLGFTPLWNNPKYPELNKLQGFSIWRQKRNMVLPSDLYRDCTEVIYTIMRSVFFAQEMLLPIPPA